MTPNPRPCASFTSMKPGLKVELDEAFYCRRAGPAVIEADDDRDFYFRCYGCSHPPRWYEFWRWFERPSAHHYVSGQINDDGRLIGIYESHRNEVH